MTETPHPPATPSALDGANPYAVALEDRLVDLPGRAVTGVRPRRVVDETWETPLLPPLLAGVAAALVCAVLWAGITVATGWQIGWMAVGVGAACGVAVRRRGSGRPVALGMVGAGTALLGCLLGNVFAVCGVLSRLLGVSFFSLLFEVGLAHPVAVLSETTGPMDALFLALAAWTGWQLAARGN